MESHTSSRSRSDSGEEPSYRDNLELKRQLFFGKGPYGITEIEVRNVFSEFGCVQHVQMFRDRATGRTTGCGVVALETHEQGSLLLMVVQWRDPEVQSKKRREAEALERQQGMECDDDKDNNKLFFSRVPPHISAEELAAFFTEQHKTVVDVDFFRNAITQESKGFGIITFDSHEAAVAALQELHDVHVWPGGFGDTMLLKWAQPPEKRRRADGMGGAGGPRFEGPPPGCDRDAVRLFVGDIPRRASKAEVAEFFSQYGKVVDLYMVKDHSTNTPKGIAYLWFAQRASAEQCMEAVDQQQCLPGHPDVQQPLRVSQSTPRAHGAGSRGVAPKGRGARMGVRKGMLPQLAMYGGGFGHFPDEFYGVPAYGYGHPFFHHPAHVFAAHGGHFNAYMPHHDHHPGYVNGAGYYAPPQF